MKQLKSLYIAIIIILFNAPVIFGQEAQDPWNGSRPDGHAPIGVMGDHTHGKGELMFSYRFMTMKMKDMRNGTEDRSNEQVLENYMVTPRNMNMTMHMLGFMYAPSDNLTLMLMTNYIINDMELETRTGTMFTTNASNFGDTKITALIRLFNKNRKKLHLNVGLSIPTGSIENKDITPASSPEETILPYPMQTGSGSFELHPGLTYLYQWGKFSGGSQAIAKLVLNENDRNYKRGNQINLISWTAYTFSNWVSGSLRAEYQYEGELSGRDKAFENIKMVTTVDPDNFGGNSLLLATGVNFYVPSGSFKNFRIGIEYEKPVYQDLNGTQLKTTGNFVVGVQYSM